MANKNVKLKDGNDYLFPQTTVANITDLTASASEINVLDGITATTEELNFCDGVTSAIQTQLNGKQPTITQGTGFDLTNNTGKVVGTEYKNASGVAFEQALKFVKCTQAEYSAITSPDSNTFYIIVG